MVLKRGRKTRFTYTNMNVQLAQPVNKKLETKATEAVGCHFLLYDIPLAHAAHQPG